MDKKVVAILILIICLLVFIKLNNKEKELMCTTVEQNENIMLGYSKNDKITFSGIFNKKIKSLKESEFNWYIEDDEVIINPNNNYFFYDDNFSISDEYESFLDFWYDEYSVRAKEDDSVLNSYTYLINTSIENNISFTTNIDFTKENEENLKKSRYNIFLNTDDELDYEVIKNYYEKMGFICDIVE